MPLHTRVASFEQDGAQFHELVREGQPYMVVQYTREKVGDYDISAARRARLWFVNVWCPINGIDPRFPG